jgi:hypothetical protein
MQIHRPAKCPISNLGSALISTVGLLSGFVTYRALNPSDFYDTVLKAHLYALAATVALVLIWRESQSLPLKIIWGLYFYCLGYGLFCIFELHHLQ